MKKHLKQQRYIVGKKQENDCRGIQRNNKPTKISKYKQGYKKRK